MAGGFVAVWGFDFSIVLLLPNSSVRRAPGSPKCRLEQKHPLCRQCGPAQGGNKSESLVTWSSLCGPHLTGWLDEFPPKWIYFSYVLTKKTSKCQAEP